MVRERKAISSEHENAHVAKVGKGERISGMTQGSGEASTGNNTALEDAVLATVVIRNETS